MLSFPIFEGNGWDMAYDTNKYDVPLCLECGGRIEYGRKDRKFCCPECKNAYHNRQHHYRRSVQLYISGALERNYDILNRLLKADITSVSLGDIAQMGFNMEYMTSFHKAGVHTEYRCFDIRYFCSPTKVYNIERVKMNY